jgi:hypothetical protein
MCGKEASLARARPLTSEETPNLGSEPLRVRRLRSRRGATGYREAV